MLIKITIASARGIEGANFPKTENPVATLLKTDPELKLVQSSNSKLSKDSLLKGFEKMLTTERQKWLSDIENGEFTIEKIVQ